MHGSTKNGPVQLQYIEPGQSLNGVSMSLCNEMIYLTTLGYLRFLMNMPKMQHMNSSIGVQRFIHHSYSCRTVQSILRRRLLVNYEISMNYASFYTPVLSWSNETVERIGSGIFCTARADLSK